MTTTHDFGHGPVPATKLENGTWIAKSAKIGKDVYAGARSIIREGAVIGDGAVIGEGAEIDRDMQTRLRQEIQAEALVPRVANRMTNISPRR